MKVVIQLCYDSKDSRQVEVEVKDGLKGERLMNGIDNAVEKSFKDDDWKRWNLIDIKH
jgi:hypothetical protein